MEVERMLLLRIGMGHSWRARRCVVLGYGGLMEGESHGSGLLETHFTPCNAIHRCYGSKEQLVPGRGQPNQALCWPPSLHEELQPLLPCCSP